MTASTPIHNPDFKNSNRLGLNATFFYKQVLGRQSEKWNVLDSRMTGVASWLVALAGVRLWLFTRASPGDTTDGSISVRKSRRSAGQPREPEGERR